MGSAVATKKKKKLSNNKKRKLEQLINDAKMACNEQEYLQAESLCQQALEIDSDKPDIYLVLGSISERMGQTDNAGKLYIRGHELDPDHLELLSALGLFFHTLKEYNAAIKCWVRYTTLSPKVMEGWQSLSAGYYAIGEWELAEEAAERALEISPNNAELHMNIALMRHKRSKKDEALASFRKALEIEPDNATAWLNLGKFYLQSEGIASALEALHKVLELNPTETSTYHILLKFQKNREYNDYMKGAEEVYSSSKITKLEKSYLAFGLGKAWEDLGDFDKSFEYYAAGNALRREMWEYNVEDDRRDTEEIKSLFTKELLDERCGDCDEGEEFLFVVGMPRSGSTLIDQILSSHPKVVSAGETELIRKVTGFVARDESNRFNIKKFLEADEKLIAGARIVYRESMKRHFGESERYTDKALPNLWLIGFIRLLFPKAKILHCARGPLDNCFSIFSNDFEGDLFKYGYDLNEVGEYYRTYLDMMNHWREVLPSDVFYDVSYESLVSAPEEKIRELVEFCGLEWDEACLNFHKSKRTVMTSSLSQVRQPIYKSSVERWKGYEKHLQPLIEVLGDAVDVSG